MELEEVIARGESRYAEFKASLPQSPEQYIKTLAAFANTQGGMLVIGVEGTSGRVVGVDSDSAYWIMEIIGASLRDSCNPPIEAEIEGRSIDGRTVITVTVEPGKNRPYCIVSRGKENVAYVRAGNTSHPASPEKIRELELEGARVSWDSQPCFDCPVTESAVSGLISDMTLSRSRKRCDDVTEASEVLLEDFGVLKKTERGWQASNAYALLTGSRFLCSRIQCAVFAGIEKGEFIDRAEYDGPLYKQAEQACRFVLRNIRYSGRIEGLFRQDWYELPPGAIREAIVNAICHRNYVEPSCIQVALYENRLEVTSPGGLYFGLRLEKALEGHTRRRNAVISRIFSWMGLIEGWGTGLIRIRQLAAEYGLPEPKFEDADDFFTVTIFREGQQGSISGPSGTQERRDTGSNPSEKYETNAGGSNAIIPFVPQGLNVTQEKIFRLIASDPKLTGQQISERIGISKRNVEMNIRKMRELGFVTRHGSRRYGYWETVKQPSGGTDLTPSSDPIYSPKHVAYLQEILDDIRAGRNLATHELIEDGQEGS